MRGIIKYHIASGKWIWLQGNDPAVNLSGADGIAFYNNSLIVNSPIEARGVVKFELDEGKERVKGGEFLEYGNKLFGDPTTGEIAGDVFYYISNAGLGAYERSTGKLDKDKLEFPVILKINLKD